MERDIEVTQEMMEAVAYACLYREDEGLAIRKVLNGKKLNDAELKRLVKKIKLSPEFQDVKKDFIQIEETTLVEDNINTILLMYNKMIQQAQYEKKYEVVARLLKEIRELKAISNNEMDFKIVFEVRKPDSNGDK